MLVLFALAAFILGQVATVGTLLVTGALTAAAPIKKLRPTALVPLIIAGLWAAGTIDLVDMFDGPLRIDANANLLGIGRGLPPALSNGNGGPAWWIATAAGATFATALTLPKILKLRGPALFGSASLATTYAGSWSIVAMYAT